MSSWAKKLAGRWIFISILLIAGGVFLAQMIVMTLRVNATEGTFVIYGLGSLVGGYLAARLSPGETVAEPAIAAMLMALGTAAIDYLMNMGVFAESFSRPSAPPTLGVVAFAGALASATLGERQPPLPHQPDHGGGLIWALISLHMLIGVAFVLLSLSGVFEPIIGHGPAVAIGVFSMLSAPVVAGFLTQLSTPRPIARSFLHAVVLLTALVAALGMSKGGIELVTLVASSAGAGLMFGGLAYLGSYLAKSRFASWRPAWRDERPETSAPRAEVRVRGRATDRIRGRTNRS